MKLRCKCIDISNTTSFFFWCRAFARIAAAVASHTSAVVFLICNFKFQIRNIKFQMLKGATQRLLNNILLLAIKINLFF
ncbi:MAG: hypothetical protein EAZ16_05270 [Sphingobacteriales bacterium]|nr:MAG: hypothetical protein EAZ16_05270 [Sphingobacteriales bacterium]